MGVLHTHVPDIQDADKADAQLNSIADFRCDDKDFICEETNIRQADISNCTEAQKEA